MGYEITAFGTRGEPVAELLTYLDDHRAAHALMGALGIDYDATGSEGDGDCIDFNRGELSAAQAALTVAVNVDEEFTRGLIFLADTLTYMKENDLADIEIGFF